MAQNPNISELAHTMAFLQKMGYEVSQLSVDNVLTIKRELLDTLRLCGMIREEENIVEAFN